MSNSAKFPPDWPLPPGSCWVVFDKLNNGKWREFCRTERSAKIMKTRLNNDEAWRNEQKGIEHIPPYDYADDVSYFTQYPHKDSK